jgi:hypothetical protein
MTIIYSQDDRLRWVRMNARHPAKVVPSHMGDSVGHYEGDSLVIDTVGIMTGPRYAGRPLGDATQRCAHVVERYRFIDGAAAKAAQEKFEKADGRVRGEQGAQIIEPDTNIKGVQIEATVEDPKIFTTPWSALVAHRRLGGPWEERVCADNPVEHYPQSGLPCREPASRTSDRCKGPISMPSLPISDRARNAGRRLQAPQAHTL